MSKKQEFLVIVSHGVKDGLTQVCFALRMAVTLQNMGISVSVYLTGPAVKLAHKSQQKIRMICAEGFDDIQTYLNNLIQNGGRLLVCPSCYLSACKITKEREMAKTLIQGAECIGMNALAEILLDSKVLGY